MKHKVYVICEPGMDRPCVQSTPPSDAQKTRNEEQGGRIYEHTLDLPGFELADGKLRNTF